jgi:hypothetical protein
MATVDIEAPGASEAALKAAIQALVPISTTTLAVHANYVDITLPSGYTAYRLVINNLSWEGNVGQLQGAFSRDGGATWVENYDTDWNAYQVSYRQQTGAAQTLYDDDIGVMVFGVEVQNGPIFCDFIIMPGSASVLPTLQGNYWTGYVSAAQGFVTIRQVCRLGTGRVNAIRFLPNNASGPSAPDAGDFIDDGATFSLYGVL